jgi:Na+/H+ antiporter NhaD/arsenite permease-like protein
VRDKIRTILLVALMAAISLSLMLGVNRINAQDIDQEVLLVGSVFDPQAQPVQGASVYLESSAQSDPIAETTTQPNGEFGLEAPEKIPETLSLHVERAHFESYSQDLGQERLEMLRSGETVVYPEIILERSINPAFWIASIVFVGMLVLIATGVIHNTLAALVGVVSVYAISYLGGYLNESLFIFDFASSLRYIDWNVIFLVMGMMIVIAVVENTGIFQWMAYISYRVSGGRLLLLLPILMLITGVASAFLDNVTTMLLMTPISIQIALALSINPLALIIPEVMASNVIGVSTLVGTPTNILIGSYAEISFTDFLQNLTPGVILAFLGLLVYSILIYRKELEGAKSASPILMEKLAERGQITEPANLKKAAWVGGGMLILFIFGESLHLLPAVTALIGATVLMVWIRPDIEQMIEAVDWTTLVFFMGLFIVVGAIQEVGLISLIAEGIGYFVGDNLALAMVAIIWFSAILSMVVANIPFTAAMLPVVGFLSTAVPGANSKVLFYCLSIGSAFGGNGSLIGASANMVTAGISDGAGYPITYAYFLKKGLPAMVITALLATIWLLVRFL